MLVQITSHKKKIREAKRSSYFPMGLERQYKICNLGLKAGHSSEGGKNRWSLKRKERPAGHSSRPVMCVLRPLHYFRKRVLASEERYARTLSDCIPITHNRRRIKNINYIFISTSPSLFVQRCNILHMVNK